MEHAENQSASTNAIAELRLRRWARLHYVPEGTRSQESWHPVVLDEMRRKDQELQAQETLNSLASTYVPLAPCAIPGLHQPHEKRVGRLWSRDAAPTAMPVKS